MIRRTKLVVAGTALALAGATLAGGLALADGPGWGHHRGHGYGWGAGPGGFGAMEGPMRLFEQADANDDGRVTQEEVRAARDERLRTFDADSDGALALDEFAALWADVTRPMTVRVFQGRDEDGDARVTAEELGGRLEAMVVRLDRNGDNAVSLDELRERGHRHGRRDRDEDRRDGDR